MKKSIIIIALCLIFPLTACGGNSTELAAMQAQIDALSQQINSVDNSEYEALKKENEELKAKIAELEEMLASSAVPTAPESDLPENPALVPSDTISEDSRIIIDAVGSIINSDTFAQWQQLYETFTTKAPSSPTVTDIRRYTINDFEKHKADYYLITVSADVGFWHDEAAQMGSVENDFCIIIDNLSGIVYDNISTNALNIEHDLSTEMGRATYILWLYYCQQHGLHDGAYLNDTESINIFSVEEIDFINSHI